MKRINLFFLKNMATFYVIISLFCEKRVRAKRMKYEKCLSCKQLGTTCDGPNFLAMDAIELGHWCDEKRKQIPGLTYDKLAADTELSKSAVYGFLHGAHTDYRLETIRPIVRRITGGKWDDNPCGNLTNSERVQMEEKVRALEKEIAWRDDKIQHLQGNNASMQMLITNTNARNTQDKDFLRSQIKGKNKTIVALSICLGITLAVIIAALIVDRLNGDIGFFWLEGLLQRNGIDWSFRGAVEKALQWFA